MTSEYDIAIIGAGPGGYVAAIRAAQLGARVICIDKRKELGGTCLNVGCIPSKALLHSSELYSKAQHTFKEMGIQCGSLSYDFDQMMRRKEAICASFNEGIAALFKKNNIAHLRGAARFSSPQSVFVEKQEIRARHFILATGSEAVPLPFLPFNEQTILSSTGALALTQVPKKLLIVGAGVIGVELGSVFARLGSEVSVVEFFPKICPSLDDALSKELLACLERQGMTFHLSTQVTAGSGTTLTLSTQEKKQQILSADKVLVCIGRRPYTQGLGLDAAGVSLDEKGFVKVDGQFRTAAPHIFAIGDLIDGPMLAHKASEEGMAVAELIAGKNPRLDYASIPNVAYTHPEVASVGLTEEEATKAGLDFTSGTFSFKANSRARCAREEEGFVKVLATKQKGRLIGVHIIGAAASELIAEAALAIRMRLSLKDLIHTPHAHPTFAEAILEAALACEKRAIHK